jgi:hypothetical protein
MARCYIYVQKKPVRSRLLMLRALNHHREPRGVSFRKQWREEPISGPSHKKDISVSFEQAGRG